MSDFGTPTRGDEAATDSHGLARPMTIDARTAVGGDEATNFTPWMARNIDVLGSVLGLDLAILDDPDDDLLNGVHIEIDVGGYFLDILATDAAGRTVAIENQYGVGDHRHLGQLLTYASGVGADVLVWVAERFNDAHLETVRWLNERTDERCGIFAVRAKFMAIGGSAAAPVFELAAGPSEWARVRRDVVSATEVWTIDSFLTAVGADREITAELLNQVIGSVQEPSSREALWFGARPNGGIYLHLHGHRYAPAYLWVNARGRSVITGGWNNYAEPVFRHPAYRHIAAALGQDHNGSASGVLLAPLNLLAVFDALVRTSDELAASLEGQPNI